MLIEKGMEVFIAGQWHLVTGVRFYRDGRIVLEYRSK